MKFTFSWLKEHLETTASVSEIADALTDLGLEVEDILDPTANLENFTFGRIIQVMSLTCSGLYIFERFRFATDRWRTRPGCRHLVSTPNQRLRKFIEVFRRPQVAHEKINIFGPILFF